MLGRCLLLTAAFAIAVILFSHFESKDDLIVRELSKTSSDDDDGLGPIPVLPQDYVLTVSPVISGDGDPPFGPFYDDKANPPYDDCTLEALWNSGDPHKQSAVEVAQNWILSRQPEIFRTIFHGEQDFRAIIELVRIEPAAILHPNGTKSYSSTMRIVVRERTAGSAHARGIREALRDNVQTGGDTYECGDWGDVKDTKSDQMIRVSFSTRPVDWDPPLPKRQCKPRSQNFNPYRAYTFHRMF